MRKIKVENCGDFYKGKTYPQIRLKGKWLREAFDPDTYVSISIEKGKIVIEQMIDQNSNQS